MRYLNKFQYLNYRKVSLLYIVFILFYFLTGSVDALRHFKSLNEVVFSRISNQDNILEEWKDSVSSGLDLNQENDLLISSADPRYELSRYDDDITTSLNRYWKRQTNLPDNNSSLKGTAFEKFQKVELPGETPNVVSSTLLGLESLRARRTERKGIFDGSQLTHEELFGLVKMQIKSVFVQGEVLSISWPKAAEESLNIYLNDELIQSLEAGNEYDYRLEQSGTFDFIFTDSKDSLISEIRVVSNNNYQFAFGQRYYHLNSGEEYIVSLHNQGFNSSNTAVSTSSDLVKAEWYQKEELKISSPNYFSGTVKLRFKAAKTDSLTLRLSSKAEFGLQFIDSKGQTGESLIDAIGVQLLSNGEPLIVLEGKLVVFHEESTAELEINRGRFDSASEKDQKVIGFMLENALVVDKFNNRISFEQPVIKWLE